jgi:hypothetical protein
MLLWFGSSAVAAIAIAWVAATIHASGHAPVGLVSVGVGIAIGASLAAIAARQNVRSTRQLIVGTIFIAILTVLAEHAWLYVDFRRQWLESRSNAQVALFRTESPPSPSEYFSRELTPQSATLWSVDALVIVAAATTTAHLISSRSKRQPESLRQEPKPPSP